MAGPAGEEQLSDVDLMAAARDRGRRAEAFTVFYRRHQRAVTRYFAARGGDASTVGDLTAETFARALQGVDRYEPDRGQPRAWLYGIARNVYANHQAAANKDREVRQRLGMRDDLVDDRATDELDRVIDQLTGAEMLDLIDRLPERQARALRLRIIDDADPATIGAAMGIRNGNARLLVHRALKSLRVQP